MHRVDVHTGPVIPSGMGIGIRLESRRRLQGHITHGPANIERTVINYPHKLISR